MNSWLTQLLQIVLGCKTSPNLRPLSTVLDVALSLLYLVLNTLHCVLRAIFPTLVLFCPKNTPEFYGVLKKKSFANLNLASMLGSA